MRNLFKPLSKRNGLFAAVVIGIILVFGIFSFIKSIIAGMTFDELRSDIILLIFGAIIEYAMVTIALSKDDPKEKENAPSEQKSETEELPPTEEEKELAKLVDKYSDDEETDNQN